MMNPVHCPYCDKKMADHAEQGSYLIMTCPKKECHRTFIVDRTLVVVLQS